ncbi:MAG: universal stress protein [Bacteroidota bacterium]
MSKIIVAIDFSESSFNAFLHGLSVARHCGCDVELLWVKKSATEKDVFDLKGDAEKEVTKKFEELIQKHSHELPNNKITYKIRSGKVYKEVADAGKEANAMMIITGTHGASVFTEFWIGSNANRIISLSSCPVVTIRAGVDVETPLKRILLPIDSTSETRQKATFTGFLAKKHKAEVYIVRMNTSSIKDMKQQIDLYAKQVGGYLEDEGVKCIHDSIQVENFTSDMINYAKKINANLISVMKNQESSASNLRMGPYTQQIVNISPIPVLVIHSKETVHGGAEF